MGWQAGTVMPHLHAVPNDEGDLQVLLTHLHKHSRRMGYRATTDAVLSHSPPVCSDLGQPQGRASNRGEIGRAAGAPGPAGSSSTAGAAQHRAAGKARYLVPLVVFFQVVQRCAAPLHLAHQRPWGQPGG